MAAVGALILAAVLASILSDADPAVFDPAALDTTGLNGAELFAVSCRQCHGTGLAGTNRGPPLVHEIYRPGHHPDAAFITAVRIGVRRHHWDFGNMPPVPDLSDAELAAIIQFIREEQAQAGVR